MSPVFMVVRPSPTCWRSPAGAALCHRRLRAVARGEFEPGSAWFRSGPVLRACTGRSSVTALAALVDAVPSTGRRGPNHHVGPRWLIPSLHRSPVGCPETVPGKPFVNPSDVTMRCGEPRMDAVDLAPLRWGSFVGHGRLKQHLLHAAAAVPREKAECAYLLVTQRRRRHCSVALGPSPGAPRPGSRPAATAKASRCSL
jgi:hypothetical protein